ncbi:hypothetical protein [Burkholderia sp. Ac-20353]|uniref:hypothetical protein n=1 Tax=Burkholderia sp. Ac-20353 TaxID=2703894 RepID=UPI00197BAFA6|nr:hypothetical protein [Burkholderia sp. Ac-20353]MBN3789026.1 hypothetical protein [Burkholderia sp. Ac-20353]
MKSKTTRILRMLSDIRRAQRCTALRAAKAAAEADAVLAERNDDATSDECSEGDTNDAPIAPRSRIGSPH